MTENYNIVKAWNYLNTEPIRTGGILSHRTVKGKGHRHE